MFKIISRKYIILALMLPFLSCTKWLDLQPQDGITGAEFWKTKEQVQAAVTGIYSSLLASPTGARSQVESFFMWGELRADMISPTLTTTNEQNDVINVNMLPTNSIANWNGIYQTINYCNSVIDFAPKVLATDATFTQEALNRALSEAKAIRALMYFYLVRTFEQVPLKLKATSTDKEVEQLAKSPQDDIVKQILKDLSEAEATSVKNYGDNASNKGRITTYAINAIQADVNLWIDKFADCIIACNKIINSNQFGLISGSNQSIWFNRLYVSGNSNESIFELQFDAQALNPLYSILYLSRRLQANATVMDERYMVDFVNADSVDIRGDGASVRATDQLIWKYVGATNTTVKTFSEAYTHWFFYRYADILLMKAEASNQIGGSGGGQTALDIIKQIRDRAHALVSTSASPAPTDKDAITDYLLAERAREFSFEGKRWFDLLRNAKRDNYKRLDLLMEVVTNTVPPNRQQSALAKFKDKNCHYLPIYFYELQTDKLLVQNPFYK